MVDDTCRGGGIDATTGRDHPHQGGSQLQLAVSPDAAGYTATFDIALDLPTAVRPGNWSSLKEEFRSE